MKPHAVFLDAATIGDDIPLDTLSTHSRMTVFPTTSDEQVEERCQGSAVVVTNKAVFQHDRLQRLSSHLKLICLTATGYDNIDTKAAAELGITVCNVRDYSTDSVAQHTLTMTLSLLQQIEYYHHFVSDGHYTHSPVFTHFGRPWYELAGKTWGIIGLGSIGRRTAEIVETIGCKVVYYSSSNKDRDPARQRLSLDELLRVSDVVSIHAPLNTHTKGLIGSAELEQMQSHSIIVNVGRGGIIQEEALADILQQNRIRGAAIDVFVDEPIQQDSPLLAVDSERLLLTPHIAWGSTEARKRVIQGVADNIGSFFAGTPQNVVS